jgi:hypothetical protein
MPVRAQLGWEVIGIGGTLGNHLSKILAAEARDKAGFHQDPSPSRRFAYLHSRPREPLLLPRGCMVIDTPGMRELAMWNDQDGLSRTFDDVEELARGCRFRDCRHQGEPGCAVKTAIEEGRLDAGRLVSYLKLKKELAHLSMRKDQRARLDGKKRWKAISLAVRRMKKHK